MRVDRRLLHREKFFYACGGETDGRRRHSCQSSGCAEGKVRFLDQTLLPHEEVWVETADYRVIAEAIRRLEVRGAPLIGIAAAYGLALAAAAGETSRRCRRRAALNATRPPSISPGRSTDASSRHGHRRAPTRLERLLVEEARRIHEEDIAANRRIGAHGAALLREQSTVLTHCNAGALATGGYGTALGVIRSAATDGRLRHVLATRRDLSFRGRA